ncbi:MAG: hypothetical protein ACYC1Q_03270 [Bacteroidia bacterium]
MKWILPVLIIMLLSCKETVDEKVVAERLDRNNELLQKQVNLLRKTFVLTSADENGNPARALYENSEIWMQHLEEELEKYQNADQSADLFRVVINRFNDSMKVHSGLLIDWSPEPLQSDQDVLLRSWKENNYLLLELAIIEKCLELHEVKSKSASESLKPVIYSAQFYQVKKGKNAIFDVAFKSKKPELVEIKIRKATLDGKRIDLKNIEVDRYTQRFILLSLNKGNYLIEGDLILVNERGEKESYPFTEKFHID